VLLLGPSVATLGLSMQIPVAAAVEPFTGHPAWLHSAATIAMTLMGTALVLMGFVTGTLAAGDRVPGEHHRGAAAAGGGPRVASASLQP
jgi:solute carrier family 35 protein F5